MSFFDPQNPGIGGFDELTDAEVLVVQMLTALGDPNANRILGWDDTDNGYQYFVIGSGLSYDHATHTLTASGTGSVTSVSATDANGFDFTITNPTTTPNITLKTTLQPSSVPFISGIGVQGLTEDILFNYKLPTPDFVGQLVIGTTSTNTQGKLYVVKNLTNKATGSLGIIRASDTTTYNVTSGDKTTYTGYYEATGTVASGSNRLINVGLFATASGGDVNTAISIGTGNFIIGGTEGSAQLHFLNGGSGSAGTAPIKLQSGTLLSVEEAGVIETDPDHIYWTDDAGIRYQLDQQAGTGTVTSFTFTDGSGFDGTVNNSTTTPTLSLTTTLTLGSVPFIGASGALLQDNTNFFWNNTSKYLGIGTNTPTYALDVLHLGSNIANFESSDDESFVRIAGAVTVGINFDESQASDTAYVGFDGGAFRVNVPTTTLSLASPTAQIGTDNFTIYTTSYGSGLFGLDDSGTVYAGDLNSDQNGNYFIVSDGSNTIQSRTDLFSVYGKSTYSGGMLSLDESNQLFKMGDVGLSGGQTLQTIDDNNGAIRFSAASGGTNPGVRIGINSSTDAAQLNIAANTTAVPQVILALGGSLKTSPIAGAIESINSHIYWTDSTNTRYQLDQQNTSSQNYKAACDYATTANLTATYSNGSSGVGATLTEVGLGALSIDGSTPSIGDRILVKNQSTTFQNGIYVVTIVGSVGVAYVLTRATDFDQSADILGGDSVFVISGTANINSLWAVNSADNPTMGTTAITFAQIGSSSSGLVVGSTAITSGTAGRILFEGSGNVLQEDSALLWNATSDFLGIGATPDSKLTVSEQATIVAPVSGTTAHFVGLDANSLRFTLDTHNNAGAGGTAFIFRRSRGTAGTPGAVQANDTIGSINGQGYGTSQYAAASTGLIAIKANENFTNTANGTYISFFTTPDASVTAAEVGRFASDRLRLGLAGTMLGKLDFAGNTSGNITVQGVAAGSGINTLQAVTDIFVYRDTTDTLTNKTLTTPVINGISTGTGVSATDTANTLVLRDGNANILADNWLGNYVSTATAAGTTTLTVTSDYLQNFSGTSTQTCVLPDATTLAVGHSFQIDNNSTGTVTLQTNGGATLQVITAGNACIVICTNVGTAAGVWTVQYSNEAVQWIKQSATYTLTNSTGVQKLFNASTNGAFAVKAGYLYEFEAVIAITSMSGTGGNMSFSLLGAGTATITSVAYGVNGTDGTTITTGNAGGGSFNNTSTSVGNILLAGTGVTAFAHIKGIVVINAAGTLIPSIALTTAAAAVVGIGTYMKFIPMGLGSVNFTNGWT